MSFFSKLFGKKSPEAKAPEEMKAPTNPLLDMLPILKPVAEMDAIKEQLKQFGDEAAGAIPVALEWPWAHPDFVVSLANDLGHSYAWLTLQDVAGHDLDELLATAMDNFLKAEGHQVRVSSSEERWVHIIENNAGLASSHLCLPGIWELMQEEAQSQAIIFAVPTRDTFIFADANRAEAVSELMDMLAVISDDPDVRHISNRAYIQREKDGPRPYQT